MSDRYTGHDAAMGCGLMLITAPFGAAAWALGLLLVAQLLHSPLLASIGSVFAVLAIALAIAVLAIFIGASRDNAAARDARRRNGGAR